MSRPRSSFMKLDTLTIHVRIRILPWPLPLLVINTDGLQFRAETRPSMIATGVERQAKPWIYF